MTAPQPLECVCRSCDHVFPVPIVAQCPECSSRYIARVMAVDLRTGIRMPSTTAVPTIERFARFLRIEKTRRRQAAEVKKATVRT